MNKALPMEDERIEELERLAGEATAPSRVLDFDLHILLIEDAIWPATDMRGRITNPNSRMSDYLRTYRDVIDADDQDFDFPRYTGSLDAAIALVRRVKPDAFWQVGHDEDDPGQFRARLLPFPQRVSLGYGATPALALIAALLRALIGEKS